MNSVNLCGISYIYLTTVAFLKLGMRKVNGSSGTEKFAYSVRVLVILAFLYLTSGDCIKCLTTLPNPQGSTPGPPLAHWNSEVNLFTYLVLASEVQNCQ